MSSLNWAAPREPAEVVILTCCAVTLFSSLKYKFAKNASGSETTRYS